MIIGVHNQLIILPTNILNGNQVYLQKEKRHVHRLDHALGSENIISYIRINCKRSYPQMDTKTKTGFYTGFALKLLI